MFSSHDLKTVYHGPWLLDEAALKELDGILTTCKNKITRECKKHLTKQLKALDEQHSCSSSVRSGLSEHEQKTAREKYDVRAVVEFEFSDKSKASCATFVKCVELHEHDAHECHKATATVEGGGYKLTVEIWSNQFEDSLTIAATPETSDLVKSAYSDLRTFAEKHRQGRSVRVWSGLFRGPLKYFMCGLFLMLSWLGNYTYLLFHSALTPNSQVSPEEEELATIAEQGVNDENRERAVELLVSRHKPKPPPRPVDALTYLSIVLPVTQPVWWVLAFGVFALCFSPRTALAVTRRDVERGRQTLVWLRYFKFVLGAIGIALLGAVILDPLKSYVQALLQKAAG